MTRAELRYIVARHEKWLRHPDSGERAVLFHYDLRGSDLRNRNLSGSNLMDSDLRDSDLRGSNLDYSAWPLWCRSLRVKADDNLVIQMLYHTLDLAQNSDISEELMAALDTDALIEQANRFHRVDECGQLNRWPKQDGESHERAKVEAERL